jgi:hypothetical protein
MFGMSQAHAVSIADAKPAPAWLIGKFEGHNAKAPSYTLLMTVNSSGKISVGLDGDDALSEGFYVGDSNVEWSDGQKSKIAKTADGVNFTDASDASNVAKYVKK